LTDFSVTDLLRKLLKKNIMWIWTPDHQAAFEATKPVDRRIIIAPWHGLHIGYKREG
jgi:hypothetical protein